MKQTILLQLSVGVTDPTSVKTFYEINCILLSQIVNNDLQIQRLTDQKNVPNTILTSCVF